MDKKTVLAVVISFLIIIGWQMFFTPVPPKDPSHIDNTASTTTTLNSNSEATATTVTEATTIANVNEATQAVIEEPIPFKSDVLEVFFDKSTGDIRKASILGWKDIDDEPITFNKGGGFNYMRLVTPIANGYDMNVVDENNGKKVSFTAKSGDVIVTKEYFIPKDSYLIKSKVIVSNAGNVSLNIPVQVKIGPKLGEGFEESAYIFEGAIISNKKTTEQVAFDDNTREELINPLYVGYTSKYFLFAAASSDYAKGMIIPEQNGEVSVGEKSFIVNPDDRAFTEFDLFIGPKEYNNLAALNLGLQSSIDFGWFYFLAIPMLQLMIFLYGIFHNYGVAIIFLTIIVKIITLPLTLKGMNSMKAMTKIQPEVMALREKFKNDPQKLNIATMELYKKNNVNPMSGCLPLIIQIPIFFALYKALLLSIELKNAPFFGWLVDLSAKDPYYITPIIMGVTMFIQQKMTPSTADPMQQKIFLAMPIIFTFLFLNFPSGLVIYWLTNNILSIIQQYVVNKKAS